MVVTVGVDAVAERPLPETVFEQLRARLGDRSQASLRITQDGGVEARYWKVDLIGPGAAAWSDTQDAGGLFRASTREVCAELQSAALPLLVPAPNCQLGVEGRDKWVPNPRASGDDTMARLRFLGVLMGAAARRRVHGAGPAGTILEIAGRRAALPYRPRVGGSADRRVPGAGRALLWLPTSHVWCSYP